jgi:E3 ubiquitin-protein ligase SspH2
MAYGKDTNSVLKQLSLFDGVLNFDYFDIDSLPNPLPPGLRVLRCSQTKVKELPQLPEGLEILVICYLEGLKVIPKLPSTLKILDCWGTPITVLPMLHDGLIELICTRTKITVLPKLPDSLKVLESSENAIKYVPKLGPNLKTLKLSSSKLVSLPEDLPYYLETLDVSNTFIKELPKLPSFLQTLSIVNTTVRQLPLLPDSLKALYLENTNVERLPNIPKRLYTISCLHNVLESSFDEGLPSSVEMIGCNCIYVKGKSIYDGGCFDCYFSKSEKTTSYSDKFNSWLKMRLSERVSNRALLIKSELYQTVYKRLRFED